MGSTEKAGMWPFSNPEDYLIRFKKTVFTSQQQEEIMKTAGQIILTDASLKTMAMHFAQSYARTMN